MNRHVFLELKDWSAKGRRKPLLLRGARQVGKTWLVEELAKQEFEFFLKVDFEENRELVQLFEGELSPDKICSELEIRTGVDIIDGKTLLFFDEVQICPRGIMSLRYFYEKRPGLHVIAAGSLLEFVFDQISFPVGRIQFLEVFPMNFSEFLLAAGYEKASEIISSPVVEVSDTVHSFLLEQLRLYLLIGGMPECVKEYIESGSVKSATEVQDEILDSYRLDFGKYKPKTDIYCLNSVFTSVASSVGQQIKYTGLTKDFSIPTIKKAYEGLSLARVISKVKSVSRPGEPLESLASDKKFKSLFLDIGLMNRVMGLDYNEALDQKNILAIYRGQLAEQFVGQEILSDGRGDIYYWSRDAKSSSAEVDFLIQTKSGVIPVEVKDGPSGKLRSLHLYRESYLPEYSVVFNSGNMGILKEERVVFLPLYFVSSFLKYGYEI